MEDDTTTTTDIPTPEAPKFKFGYVVLVDENGGLYLEKNPAVFSISVEREATLIEVRRHTSEILMDLTAQAAAEYTALRIRAEEMAASQDS
jgi:hypothetical protein